MNIESISLTGNSQLTMQKPAEDIEVARKTKSGGEVVPFAAENNKVQPEELLSQIKSMTEDGLYSVRFENDEEAQQLVVKIVDTKTDEVIRQVPAEEILTLSSRLEELRGNIVDIHG